MKFQILKRAAVFMLAVVFAAATSDVKAQTREGAPKAKQTDDDFKKEMDGKMAKFNEQYSKLQQKAASTNDPQMKADINGILGKMDAAKADMTRYESQMKNMSDAEKEQARGNIQRQMESIRSDYETTRAKYGQGEKGGKQGGAKQQEGTKQQGGAKKEAAAADKSKEQKTQKAQQEMKGEKRNKSGESTPK